MSEFKMGEIIAEIREESEKRRGVARLLGLVSDGFGGAYRWIAWRLWGRRRAIRRMKQLAGLTRPEKSTKDDLMDAFKVTPVGVIEPFGRAQSSHEQTIKEIESVREPLPRPDVVDDPTAN